MGHDRDEPSSISEPLSLDRKQHVQILISTVHGAAVRTPLTVFSY